MEGKINVFGDADVMFAVYKDGTYSDTIPGKSDGYRFDKAVCTNGATASWNKTDWSVKVNSLTKTKTKCSLYFLTGEEPTGGIEFENKIQELLDDWLYGDQVVYEQEENDNNIRFIGPTPDNWVKFNGEQWRIIGLMDGIQTKNNGIQRLLKIIRYESLGEYSWDSSDKGVNNGYGVNEWNKADIQKVLNENYFNQQSGGTCYGASNDYKKACPDWSKVGLNTTAQNMVEEVVWNTGTMDAKFNDAKSLITPLYMYSAVRSSGTGKQCSDGIYCNDGVPRQPTWTGKVGLMYPSDYGLATSGSQLKMRKQCLGISMYSWETSANYCYQNNWLYNSNSNQWTMTSVPDAQNANYVLHVYTGGKVSAVQAPYAYAVRPVVFLKSSVKITGGDGSSGNPYTLSI